MSIYKRVLAMTMKRRGRSMSATKLIAVILLGIITVGTCLLMLPAAARSGEATPFLQALFTATSATCVTGLTPFDTWTHWSGFGQGVLLCLIEVGGLGFMSAATLVIFLFRRKVGLRQRMIMAQALSLNEMNGVVKLQRTVIIGSLSLEALGALILTLRFGRSTAFPMPCAGACSIPFPPSATPGLIFLGSSPPAAVCWSSAAIRWCCSPWGR